MMMRIKTIGPMFRLGAALIVASVGLLASGAASFASVGAGEVSGTMDFLNASGDGIPISGCVNGDAGDLNMTGTGVMVNTSPPGAFVATGISGTFTSTTCESVSSGAGTVDSATLLGCTTSGTYVRNGLVLRINLNAPCPVTLVLELIPTTTSPCISSAGATTCVARFDAGGQWEEA
jgi:hypothetical protein